jgi:hypothetical protein
MDHAKRVLENGIPAVDLILVVLGAFPQAVEVFGMKGVPWTQAWGVSYFAAYIFTVLTTVCARPDNIISIQPTVSRNVREMPVKNLTSNLLRRLPCTSRRMDLDVVRSVYVEAGA